MRRRYAIHRIKKADIILIVGCLLAAVLLGFFFVIHREEGSTVRIFRDGEEVKRIALAPTQNDSGTESVNGYYLIICTDDGTKVEYYRDKPEPKLTEGTSYNILSVIDGTVVMEAADCADQICVRHKPVSSSRESIICLPHRIVVEIIGDEKSDDPLDGVVR